MPRAAPPQTPFGDGNARRSHATRPSGSIRTAPSGATLAEDAGEISTPTAVLKTGFRRAVAPGLFRPRRARGPPLPGQTFLSRPGDFDGDDPPRRDRRPPGLKPPARRSGATRGGAPPGARPERFARRGAHRSRARCIFCRAGDILCAPSHRRSDAHHLWWEYRLQWSTLPSRTRPRSRAV